MARNMIAFAFLAGIVSLTSGLGVYAPCTQRSANDFRADENDCSRFHICSLGQLITYSCAPGGVFNERSGNCVPVNSYLDTCTQRMTMRQRCQNQQGLVHHPTLCAQYYDCGATQSRNRPGWESQLRECPYPFVFSMQEKKCVQPAVGVCGTRQEPVDPCDYKENQCDGHSGCVPCMVRFPSCRGRQDGANEWYGREGSPYYITCHQQRVQSTAMCAQEGAVMIFDPSSKRCVKKETEPALPQIMQPGKETETEQPSFVPLPALNTFNQNQNGNAYHNQNQYGTPSQARYPWF